MLSTALGFHTHFPVGKARSSTYLVTKELPLPLPAEIENRVARYENEAIAINERAKKQIAERVLWGNLKLALEKSTKEGKLDEAVNLRQLIADITADIDSQNAPEMP